MTGSLMKTPQREAPQPLEGPERVGSGRRTILWFVPFLVQLPFYGWFDDHGHTWWIWTCLAGGGLGLIGIWYVRGREAALKRAAAADEPGAGDDAGDGTGNGTGTGTGTGSSGDAPTV